MYTVSLSILLNSAIDPGITLALTTTCISLLLTTAYNSYKIYSLFPLLGSLHCFTDQPSICCCTCCCMNHKFLSHYSTKTYQLNTVSSTWKYTPLYILSLTIVVTPPFLHDSIDAIVLLRCCVADSSWLWEIGKVI